MDAVVRQQFEVGRRIMSSGLVPIIEPEIDIHSPQKAEAEELLKAALLAEIATLGADEHHAQAHPARAGRLLRRARASTPTCCGSSRCPAATPETRPTRVLARNHGVVASFSRALTEGLTAQQSPAEFNAALDSSIESIFQASIT